MGTCSLSRLLAPSLVFIVFASACGGSTGGSMTQPASETTAVMQNSVSTTTAEFPTSTSTTTTMNSLTTAASTTLLPPPSCQTEELGITPSENQAGPVAVCLSAFAGGGFLEIAKVLSVAGITTAEQALNALARGLDEEYTQRGYVSLIPPDWEGQITVGRLDSASLLIDLTQAVFDINGLSTLDNGDIFLVQIFGTAFSDTSVNEVTITVDGDRDTLCGFLQRRPGCTTVTRDAFFTG